MRSSRCIALLATLLLSLAAHAQFFPPHLPFPPVATEYVNGNTGDHVLVGDVAETAAIESGAAGPGWKPTGYVFQVLDAYSFGGDGNVCRFYSPSANSHFNTAFADECNALRLNPASGWIFEKVVFSAPMPLAGVSCPDTAASPVYRLFNERGDPENTTHRFTPDPELRAELRAAGWRDEGVAFCTHTWSYFPVPNLSVTRGTFDPSNPTCDDETALRSCTAVRNLPPMPNLTKLPTLPPVDGTSITGIPATYEFYSAYPASNPQAVAEHTFLQTGIGASIWGVHLNSLDRIAGDYSSIGSIYRFPTAAPAPNATDPRVLPWGDRRDNHLEIEFSLRVKTLRLFDAGSHAYGYPTLRFVDRSSGRRLNVSIGAYGSVSPLEDYLGRDASGAAIVSTTFRANPAFGKVLSGEWVVCSGSGGCNPAPTEGFKFRLDRAAFRTVLARARTVDPALSADIGDYILAAFSFNNEVYRNAELGMTVFEFWLRLYQR